MENAELSQVLEAYLRPLTFPVAAKLSEAPEVPKGYSRPSQTMGCRHTAHIQVNWCSLSFRLIPGQCKL